MGEIQQGEGNRKGKGGEGRGVVLIEWRTGERRRRKGKGQLSLSSTLSCFMCPSLAAPLVLPCRVTKKGLRLVIRFYLLGISVGVLMYA